MMSGYLQPYAIDEEREIQYVEVPVGGLGPWHFYHITLSILFFPWAVVYLVHYLLNQGRNPRRYQTVEVPYDYRIVYRKGHPLLVGPDEADPPGSPYTTAYDVAIFLTLLVFLIPVLGMFVGFATY